MERASRNTPIPGDVIAGKYRITRKLGEGGMGVVYGAEHTRLGQSVAIKMLLPRMAMQPELVARFEREARAAATIDSPNVAKVMDVDLGDNGLPYMVIELLEGHDLGDELDRSKRLPIADAASYVATAATAIAHAHQKGVIHRDLKPSNLFLARKDGAVVLKILDFGIAKVEGSAKLTSSASGFGTPHYMSPEQIRRATDVDGRTDVWSLGMILYELLTGVVPLPDDGSAAIAAIVADPIPPPRTLRPEIPEALEAVIMRALEKDKTLRYASAAELAEALAVFVPENHAAQPHAAAAPPSTRASLPTLPALARTPSLSDASSRGRRLVGAALTMGLLAVVVFVGFFVQRGRLDRGATASMPPITQAAPQRERAEPVAEIAPAIASVSSAPALTAVQHDVAPAVTTRASRSKAPQASPTAAVHAASAPSDYPLTL